MKLSLGLRLAGLLFACLPPALPQTVVTLTPSPTSLTFTYTIGSALPAAQAVSIRASAGSPAYTTSITGTNTQWLTVAPDTGVMPPAAPEPIGAIPGRGCASALATPFRGAA